MKIVINIVVAFSTLIRNKIGESVVVTQLDDEGELDSQALLMPTHKNKSDLTYMQLLQAFFIYATVYCQYHPHEFTNLLKYADTIRELVVARARWQYYDAKFRRNREKNSWPWQAMQIELWGKAMTIFREEESRMEIDDERRRYRTYGEPYQRTHQRWSGAKRAGTSQSRPSSRNGVGYCFAYNIGEYCKSPCQYEHKCYKCDGIHKATNCQNRPPAHRGAGRPLSKSSLHLSTLLISNNSSKVTTEINLNFF